MSTRSHVAILTVGLLLLPLELVAQSVRLPRGTAVYGELEETVRSKKKETALGDLVRARAWRNVVVDGNVVIEAGAPMMVRVASFKPAKFAGIKGKLELEAVSVQAVDGSDVMLDGGYDKSGKGRKALSISLAALVAWPLVFIKGKQAVLESGTVFDGEVQADTSVLGRPLLAAASGPAAAVAEAPRARLDAEVLYDEMDPDGEVRDLPLTLTLCHAELAEAEVVTVNERLIDPAIPLSVGSPQLEGGCSIAGAELDLKLLAQHFSRGINRFEIDAGGARTEVVLDIEL